MTQLKLISWNVNGIRAAEKKGFLDWLRDSLLVVVRLASCDNQLRVYLNGDDVAASEAWETPAKETVTRSVKKGRA